MAFLRIHEKRWMVMLPGTGRVFVMCVRKMMISVYFLVSSSFLSDFSLYSCERRNEEIKETLLLHFSQVKKL